MPPGVGYPPPPMGGGMMSGAAPAAPMMDGVDPLDAEAMQREMLIKMLLGQADESLPAGLTTPQPFTPPSPTQFGGRRG